ncbi:hypothetical protein [Brevibacillus agri]|uniref:hypothetical protein n=1 Tax=Brevibacillus agri TaxID=51101 RepID=UPI0013ED1167|nr:hypothetical protein [Brevibacillus agri]
MFGHLKCNRSFRRFSLRDLEKMHTEFAIVALAHNLLKVAGIRLATFQQKQKEQKSWTGNIAFSRPTFLFWGLIRQPLFRIVVFSDHHTCFSTCERSGAKATGQSSR